VGFIICTRGEIPGKRKPVIRKQHNNNNSIKFFIFIKFNNNNYFFIKIKFNNNNNKDKNTVILVNFKANCRINTALKLYKIDYLKVQCIFNVVSVFAIISRMTVSPSLLSHEYHEYFHQANWLENGSGHQIHLAIRLRMFRASAIKPHIYIHDTLRHSNNFHCSHMSIGNPQSVSFY
jgi:hypothetical protein